MTVMDDTDCSRLSILIFQVAGMFKAAFSKDTPKIPENLSEAGKDFLQKCLQRDPNSRPTATQLMDHPFVRGVCSAADQISWRPFQCIPGPSVVRGNVRQRSTHPDFLPLLIIQFRPALVHHLASLAEHFQ